MNSSDLTALLPFVIVAAASITALLAISLRRSHALVAVIAVAGFVLALASLGVITPVLPRTVTSLLRIDSASVFFTALILSAGLAVALSAHSYLGRLRGQREEFYVLLLIASLGASVLAASIHFATFFLGLEVLTVSLYAMIAYVRSSDRGLEAGIKYLLLAAASSAFILFGMALIYAETGSMAFDGMVLQAEGHALPMAAGIGMIVVGVGFKLALVPFHLWTPDVYEGAPAPATAFIATASKAGVFAVLIRFAGAAGLAQGSVLVRSLSLIAVLSMFSGNLLALLQTNVKRILAYSSISHSGYLLVAILASGAAGREATAFYLAAYVITVLGAFGVVSALSGADGDAVNEDDYRGLAWRRPWLAAVMTAMLLSLAGLPVTAGFIGKFFLVSAGIESSLWVPVWSLVISSVIGLFYYLRLIALLYAAPDDAVRAPSPLTVADGVVLSILLLAILWAGALPGSLLAIVHRAMH